MYTECIQYTFTRALSVSTGLDESLSELMEQSTSVREMDNKSGRQADRKAITQCRCPTESFNQS